MLQSGCSAGFVGIKNNPNGSVNNNISGPDGVAAHGRWLYAGDGDSTVKVFDLNAPNASALKQTISTVPPTQKDKTRVDEMALSADGKFLIAANNAEDPPFCDAVCREWRRPHECGHHDRQDRGYPRAHSARFGLSIEQPTWEPKTKRFYVSIPTIANNPPGCNADANAGTVTCSGGLFVIDPHNLPAPTLVDGVMTSVIGAFDRQPTPASCRSTIADRTVPRSDRILICCWAAPRRTSRATRPRWSSTR